MKERKKNPYKQMQKQSKRQQTPSESPMYFTLSISQSNTPAFILFRLPALSSASAIIHFCLLIMNA